jgi:hypothetical protein
MEFDVQRYLREMQQLVATGCLRLAVRHPRVRVYSVSVWTDPDARGSAISFDTLANSRLKVAASDRYRKRQHAELLREGDRAMARLFAKPSRDRNSNPADFAFRSFHEVNHRSMPALWEERSDRRCWTELEPALREVAKLVLPTLAELRLEKGAVLGINSRRDWFDRTWPIGRT